MVFQWSCMDVRIGLCRKLSAGELMLLWCWRRLLRVPWTTRISNQSILKEISPRISLEGKLKLQYFGHLMRRVDSFERTLMLGGRRRRGQQRMRWLMASLTQWTWVLVDSWNWWWTRNPDVLWFMGSQRVGHDWVTELNWWKVEVWTYWSCRYTFVGIHFKVDRKCWVWQDILLLGSKTGIWFSVGTCINLLFLWD